MSTAAETVPADLVDEEDFRTKVQSFLKEHASPRTEAEVGVDQRNDVRQAKTFQLALYEAGLAGLTWPRPYGGQGLPGRYQTLYNNEAAQYDLPVAPFGIGFGMCMPTILTHGTEDQKERFVRPALKGEEIWCQLFSEPSSGSDLASLRSSVVRDGDEWVLNGQKVWTSGAHYSQYAILVARSDPDQPKHRGLSMFILDMSSPGITVRPLRQMTGQAHFNEVFFDDVRIPAERILAEPGDGWRCAITVLMNERVGAARSSAEKTSRLAPISTHLKVARARGVLSDPLVRQDLMDLVPPYKASWLARSPAASVGTTRWCPRSGRVPQQAGRRHPLQAVGEGGGSDSRPRIDGVVGCRQRGRGGRTDAVVDAVVVDCRREQPGHAQHPGRASARAPKGARGRSEHTVPRPPLQLSWFWVFRSPAGLDPR